jgi:hypothetical protein
LPAHGSRHHHAATAGDICGQDEWDRLVERYADAKAHAAYLATDDAAGETELREADERYEALRRIAERYEDQVLSTDAPSMEAARR